MNTRLYRPLGMLAAALMTVAACLVTSGCDDSDASNITVTVNPDLSGTMRATRLVIPDDSTNGQPSTGGVSWNASAQIITSRGAFASLSDVKFEDITFSCETTPRGLKVLRVTLPRGPEAKWAKALTQPSGERRRETTQAIFPERKESRLGSVIAITITLPAEPISHGVAPMSAGISATVEKNVATLSVRVDMAMKAGNEIVWDMTWSDVAK